MGRSPVVGTGVLCLGKRVHGESEAIGVRVSGSEVRPELWGFSLSSCCCGEEYHL